MHIVAIYGLRKDKEALAAGLAAALGITHYESRARLLTPGEGPLVVAVVAEEEKAQTLLQNLRSNGFQALVLSPAEIEAAKSASAVRRFSLGEQELIIEAEGGQTGEIPYAAVDLILRGIMIESSTSEETEKTRKISIGRAVASGGLSISKTTKTIREVRNETREGFMNLYAGEGFPFLFRESRLIYDSLGPARQPSRAANFSYLTAELRRRCPHARYDDRLLGRPGQAGLLGPALDAEANLPVATALLARVLRQT